MMFMSYQTIVHTSEMSIEYSEIVGKTLNNETEIKSLTSGYTAT